MNRIRYKSSVNLTIVEGSYWVTQLSVNDCAEQPQQFLKTVKFFMSLPLDIIVSRKLYLL